MCIKTEISSNRQKTTTKTKTKNSREILDNNKYAYWYNTKEIKKKRKPSRECVLQREKRDRESECIRHNCI